VGLATGKLAITWAEVIDSSGGVNLVGAVCWSERPLESEIGDALKGGRDASSPPVVRISRKGVMKVPARKAMVINQIFEADTGSLRAIVCPPTDNTRAIVSQASLQNGMATTSRAHQPPRR